MNAVDRAWRANAREGAGTRPRSKRGTCAATSAIWLSVVTVLAGCNSGTDYRFERLELLPSQEEVLEFPLGEYAIPVPVNSEKTRPTAHGGNRLQIQFTLSAVISPKDEPRILDAWQHSQGRIRDQVIKTCRNASIDDLEEPDLVTLKMRMRDAVEPYLGRNQLRTLVVPQVQIYKL